MFYSEPHDHNPLLVSALNVVRGFTTPVDLVRIQTNTQVWHQFSTALQSGSKLHGNLWVKVKAKNMKTVHMNIGLEICH